MRILVFNEHHADPREPLHYDIADKDEFDGMFQTFEYTQISQDKARNIRIDSASFVKCYS